MITNIDYRIDTPYKLYIHIIPKKITGYDHDKYYVGITRQKNIKQRWRNGKGYKKNKYFWRAIQKYGWNKIEHEIIATNLTKDEAINFEKLMIKKLNSNDYHFGYNITSGGEGVQGLFGEKNPNFGKHWSIEQKRKMSEYKKKHPTTVSEEGRKRKSDFMKEKWKDEEFRKSRTGENAPCYGRTGEKHPLYGKPGYNSKKVICLNTKELFSSAVVASKNKNANHSKICMVCRGERISSGKDEKGKPLHWMYFEDYIKENNISKKEAMSNLFFVA